MIRKNIIKYTWCFVNTGLVAWSVYGGFNAMSPARERHSNPDVILSIVLLVVMPVFANGIVSKSKSEKLLRPSWKRNPLNWRGDPLQGLFILTCILTAFTAGCSVRLFEANHASIWVFSAFCSMTIGLLIGQVLVYKRYETRIAGNDP